MRSDLRASEAKVIGWLVVGVVLGWLLNTVLLLGFLAVLVVPEWLRERKARKVAVSQLLASVQESGGR